MSNNQHNDKNKNNSEKKKKIMADLPNHMVDKKDKKKTKKNEHLPTAAQPIVPEINTNTLMQYYSLVYSYLMNSQQQYILNNLPNHHTIPTTLRNSFDVNNNNDRDNTDLNESEKQKKNSNMNNKITNFSVDALLNVV